MGRRRSSTTRCRKDMCKNYAHDLICQKRNRMPHDLLTIKAVFMRHSKLRGATALANRSGPLQVATPRSLGHIPLRSPPYLCQAWPSPRGTLRTTDNKTPAAAPRLLLAQSRPGVRRPYNARRALTSSVTIPGAPLHRVRIEVRESLLSDRETWMQPDVAPKARW